MFDREQFLSQFYSKTVTHDRFLHILSPLFKQKSLEQ